MVDGAKRLRPLSAWSYGRNHGYSYLVSSPSAQLVPGTLNSVACIVVWFVARGGGGVLGSELVGSALETEKRFRTGSALAW